MLMADTWINRKGLLKCCVLTLMNISDEEPRRLFGQGDTVQCKFSKGNQAHRMIVFNGQWRWVDPVTVEAQEREKLRAGGLLWDHVRGRQRD